MCICSFWLARLAIVIMCAHRIEHPDHIIDANDIEIIDRANTGFKLTIKEMMHISQEKPQLNIQHAASYKNKNVEQYKINLNTFLIAYQS